MHPVLAQYIMIGLFGLLTRWTISLNSYSGAAKPPMYGDYEAQRHWMEVTYNLPVSEWYRDGPGNNLTYWGLDYPPLTAYHSWINGFISHLINPEWVELHKSRGYESYSHKLFMRYTVLVADLLVFIPAVFVYFYCCRKDLTDSQKILYVFLILICPAFSLIDYGHFQYNCISLGLCLWAVIFLTRQHDLLGASAFVLALNYKQMELYHACAFFFYLLGRCLHSKKNWGFRFVDLLKVAAVVIVTTIIVWSPFLTSVDAVLQVLHRIFPFARGLYEDKVANVWCSLSVLIKWKEHFRIQQLALICLGTTALAILPSGVHLLLKPSVHRFKISLIICSLAFFLFSFQVHEKSILIPAVSVCMLFPLQPLICAWFFVIATLSMLPLLIKDGLTTAYVSNTVLFLAVFAYMTYYGHIKLKSHRILQFLFVLAMAGVAVLTVGILTLKPPSHLPDLFPLLISVFSCLHFLAFLLFFYWLQFTSRPPLELASKEVTLERKKQL